MSVITKQRISLFVDKESSQWIVLDQEGKYWILPSVENPWQQRQPFEPTNNTELAPIPGHYKTMLGVPP